MQPIQGCLPVLLAATIVGAGFAATTFPCDSGSLATACVVNSAHVISDELLVEGLGTGTLEIQQAGSIICSRSECEIRLSIGSASIDGDLTASLIEINTTTGNIVFTQNSAISTGGRGFFGDEGPGTGRNGTLMGCDATLSGAGGAHGGKGGTSLYRIADSGCIATESDYPIGGNAHDSAILPLLAGSGGQSGYRIDGAFSQRLGQGGRGGGVILLRSTANITFVQNPVLDCNGATGGYSNRASGGGGAGGTIRLHANRINGAGRLFASGGGFGDRSYRSGTGSGGRIAFHLARSGKQTYVPATIQARTGSPANSQTQGQGGGGTIVVLANAAEPFENYDELAHARAVLALARSRSISVSEAAYAYRRETSTAARGQLRLDGGLGSYQGRYSTSTNYHTTPLPPASAAGLFAWDELVVSGGCNVTAPTPDVNWASDPTSQ